MPLLTEEEVANIIRQHGHAPWQVVREAVRLAGERAAQICEERGKTLAKDVRGKARAWDCVLDAAAIREASK